jgi:MFS family permease
MSDSSAAGAPGRLITLAQIMLVVVLWNGAFKGSRVLNTLYALDLGATPLQTGLLLATYGVFPLLLAVAAGRIADRYGSRVPVVTGMMVCAVGVVLPWFAPSLGLLFAAAAVTGLGFIMTQVALQSLVGSLGEGEARTRNFNNYTLVVAAADFLGPVFAGFSIDHVGHLASYLVMGLFSVSGVITILMFARGIPLRRRPAPRPAGQSMLDLFRDADMRRVLIASAVVMTGIDLFQLYMPLYGHQIGLSASAIGMIIGAAAVATFASRALIPTLTAHYGKATTLLYSLFLTAAMFALIPLVTNGAGLGLICFVLGLGMGLGQPLTVMLCYQYSPPGRAGESLGLRIAINNSMHVAAPAAFGAVGSALGLAPVFWFSAGIIAAGNWYARRRPAA